MEPIRDFLIYVARMYQDFDPYIKGIHLTINRWILGKDEGRRELLTSHLLEGLTDGKWDMPEKGDTGPLYVEAVPRLDKELVTLDRFTESKKPPVRLLRD